MLKLKYDGYDVQFTFHHDKDAGPPGIKGMTFCDLIVNGVQYFGMSACSVHDQFNKEVGRKVALSRAIKYARDGVEIPKNVRQAIWHRYFYRHYRNDGYQEWIDNPVFAALDDPKEYAGGL